MRSLAQLERDEKCRVERLLLAGDMRRRLMELGLTEGAEVSCVLCGSGIRAYFIRGAVIALRDEDGQHIKVTPQNSKKNRKICRQTSKNIV